MARLQRKNSDFIHGSDNNLALLKQIPERGNKLPHNRNGAKLCVTADYEKQRKTIILHHRGR